MHLMPCHWGELFFLRNDRGNGGAHHTNGAACEPYLNEQVSNALTSMDRGIDGFPKNAIKLLAKTIDNSN